MQKTFFIVILLGVTIASVTRKKIQLDKINNKKMIARDFDKCIAQSPDNCCFNGIVTLTIDYDDAKIYSFKFRGKQAGKNCDGTYIAYPTAKFSTKKTIEEGTFKVVNEYFKFETPLFYYYQENIINEDKTIWNITFPLIVGEEQKILLELYFDSEQNYIEDSNDDSEQNYFEDSNDYTIASDTIPQLKLDEINNKKMIARNFDKCIAKSPDNCCFNDIVTLTIDYDDAKIYSFKFRGKQAGKNCDGTYTAYPLLEFSTKKTIEEGTFKVTNENFIQRLPFFYNYQEDIINEDKTIWNITIPIAFNEDQESYLELYFDSEQDYIEDSKEEIDNAKEEIDNAKEEIANAKEEIDNAKEEIANAKEEIDNAKEEIDNSKQGSEVQNTSSVLVKFNILFLICSYVVFNFML